MNKFWKVLTGCAVAVALMPLAACDNEDYSSSPDRPDYNVNYVYLYEPVEAYSTIDFKATGDFLSTLDNPLALCPRALHQACSRGYGGEGVNRLKPCFGLQYR